ncbi:21136_t:CDS:1, partial [Gigaspora margarita]
MDNSQNDDFISFSLPNLSPQHDNFNEDLDSGETSDSLDNLSSEEESTNSASTTKFQNNKFNQKRPPSWTKPFFDTYRLEKKRKCNVLISTKQGKIKCSHPFNLKTRTGNLASHLRI